jgi:hypothetical protein
MGRHTAADGSSVHPLVAAGLARREAGAVGPRRHAVPGAAHGAAGPGYGLADAGQDSGDQGSGDEGSGDEGSGDEGSGRRSDVGWPDPPRRGEGLGWPGDIPDGTEDAPPQEPTPRARRRGWRRLFGVRAAA